MQRVLPLQRVSALPVPLWWQWVGLSHALPSQRYRTLPKYLMLGPLEEVIEVVALLWGRGAELLQLAQRLALHAHVGLD